MKTLCFPVLVLFHLVAAWSVSPDAAAQTGKSPFLPLDGSWRPPNECRLASGAPGPAYWQQRADYRIAVRLEETVPRITGEETITYYNRSPHSLEYLWLQLDQNLRRPDSKHRVTEPAPFVLRPESFPNAYNRQPDFAGGHTVTAVTDASGQGLPIRVVETNMRVDLPVPLAPGAAFTFRVAWSYPINNARIEGRSGYEYFPEDRNYIFEIAQFYPRMCVYDDINGWQNKPFYGDAEFALEFGDFEVEITLPEHYVVSATGELQNEEEVLDKEQRERLARAKAGEGEPVFIVGPEEAEANEKLRGNKEKTWRYKAENVRDFAFAASRKFIWQAAGVTINGKKVLAQSLFPREAMPLWDKYATHAVIHTLRTYSRYSVDYPYPNAIAVHGAVWGMEYPMICFCGGRPLRGGYYSRQTKYNTIGVIIHEVGHNFFPMVVNSDERKWAWMDEGLNSFLEYLTEQEFEPNFPHRRGPADQFAPFMASPAHQPVMTNPESILSNGKTSYEKVAVGLKILRDQIMGPELYDEAFRRYARWWAFKRPTPEDFFRSMEDVGGMDLAWFWRSWFYESDPVDLGVRKVVHYALDGKGREWQPDPTAIRKEPATPGELPHRNYYIDGKPELRDGYTGQASAPEEEGEDDDLLRRMIAEKGKDDPAEDALHVYHITFENVGGCPMPVPFEIVYRDGSRDLFRLPAEIWMIDHREFTKQISCPKEAVAIRLDPHHTLPDTDRQNNFFPRPAKGQAITDHDLR